MLDEILNYLNENFPDHEFKVGMKKENIFIPHWIEEDQKSIERKILEIEIDERHEYAQIIQGMPNGIEEFAEEQIYNNLYSITERHINILAKKDENKDKNESKQSA